MKVVQQLSDVNRVISQWNHLSILSRIMAAAVA
jgi:hypothetical protein